MPLCCCCAPTTVIIHVMSLREKSLQHDALKKIAPPKKYTNKVDPLPPPTTIGREIFAPPRPPSSSPSPGHR